VSLYGERQALASVGICDERPAFAFLMIGSERESVLPGALRLPGRKFGNL
jgi:hypothetical protein